LGLATLSCSLGALVVPRFFAVLGGRGQVVPAANLD
jgi:hypothetical protein